ncbi:heparin lyase I family protein [Ensifer adhaerens]|uniref:Heparin lyase I family protein n=1 Tax=Ensifer adhaerens TaxID=106592 RepID=A0ABY8HS53_ENSAD|nr:heparin lyase I family protein [Ensifer adhaerens]WFP94941.1 heparin lyase I family protein [Ensifer adhaerens]
MGPDDMVKYFILSLSMLGISSVCSSCIKTLSDDFSQLEPSSIWFVCHRDENSFSFGKVPGEARTAMTATVRPRLGIQAFAPAATHSGCRDADGNYEPDGRNERAELWEEDSVWLPLGTDIWYRFDMYVDDSVVPGADRTVIGQWKQTSGPLDASPVLAQRFTNRTFTITIEQDNDRPGRNPADAQCRILVATEASSSDEIGHGGEHDVLAPPSSVPEKSTVLSIGHASDSIRYDPIRGFSKAVDCTIDDISITTFHPLPEVFGTWTTMVYHVRFLPDHNGLVEVWANGKAIARAAGRIGFRPTTPRSRQYFKFALTEIMPPMRPPPV